MARFDVYISQDGKDYVLDCQADVLEHFDTRFVVPLIPAKTSPSANRLNPIFEIKDSKFVLAKQLASAVDVADLGKRITNLEHHSYTILDALDMLITGY